MLGELLRNTYFGSDKFGRSFKFKKFCSVLICLTSETINEKKNVA